MKINNSTLKFINNYHKPNYNHKEETKNKEFDINQKQAPLKTFNTVNKEKGTEYKYKFFAHKRKIYSFLDKKNAERVEGLVLEFNDYEISKIEG